MSQHNEYHIPIEQENQTAVFVLAEASGLSQQKIKAAMQKGCVWLEQSRSGNKSSIKRCRRAKKILSIGNTLHFYYDAITLATEPPEATLVSDEGTYSIWNKPSGMLSQGSKWGDHFTVYRWAEKHLKPERPAFIVHRLDRAANGLILIAHKKQIAAKLSAMFEQHQIEKHYRATVEGDFSAVIANGETRKTIAIDIDDKQAVSHVKLLEYNQENNESSLDVHIETGRKHQIRKHLSALGFPIVGDRLYGSAEIDRDLQLSSVSLSFQYPVTGEKRHYQLQT